MKESSEIIRRYDEVLSIKASKHSLNEVTEDLDKRLARELEKVQKMCDHAQ